MTYRYSNRMATLAPFLWFALTVLAARPFLNEPDTGFDPFIPANGSLPPLDSILSLPDFDTAAQNYMSAENYSYYRTGAGGEWSYRNNLETFGRIRFRPRTLIDITNIGKSLPTTILGYEYSMPFFIAPAARAGYANPEGERSIMRAAEAANILYIPSFLSTVPLEEIMAEKDKSRNFTTFQQLYIENNDTLIKESVRRIENSGQKAIVLTIDSAADGVRPRGQRYGMGSADTGLTFLTWDKLEYIRNLTHLPVIPKGIATVEDARKAVEIGLPAIYLSNHGGRQLDYSPSPMEVVLEIHQEAPEVFHQVEVWADGGVRYGTDMLKMLALGVKAVGLARPFMYANCFADQGISHAIDLLGTELMNDAANLGIPNLKQINSSSLNLKYAAYGSSRIGF